MFAGLSASTPLPYSGNDDGRFFGMAVCLIAALLFSKAAMLASERNTGFLAVVGVVDFIGLFMAIKYINFLYFEFHDYIGGHF
jgi:hypothetical protein